MAKKSKRKSKDVKMDKNTWLEKYENTVIINYPNGVGTIYKVVRRRDD